MNLRLLYLLFLFFLNSFLAKSNQVNLTKDSDVDFFGSSPMIDQYDTVTFNIGLGNIIGNSVEFPVSIHSDETVNALDLSFKFNHLNLTFDSIISLKPYLQIFSYYNASDSLLSLTSSSLQAIENDSNLLTIRFSLASGTLCSTDLNAITAYLNGDPCSYNVTNCITNSVNDMNVEASTVNLYPNPARNILNVFSSQKGSIEILDVTGKTIIKYDDVEKSQVKTINMEYFPNGIYLLRLYNENFNTIKKVLINKE